LTFGRDKQSTTPIEKRRSNNELRDNSIQTDIQYSYNLMSPFNHNGSPMPNPAVRNYHPGFMHTPMAAYHNPYMQFPAFVPSSSHSNIPQYPPSSNSIHHSNSYTNMPAERMSTAGSESFERQSEHSETEDEKDTLKQFLLKQMEDK
jgi:hypothetical protein